MLIIVPTCASFADTWEPFFALLARYWRDLPDAWDIHLLTDSVPVAAPLLRVDADFIHDKADPSWCRRLHWFLTTQVPRERVALILQDDMFLMGHANTVAIRAAEMLLLRREDIGSVRLNPCPGPADETPIEHVAGVPLGEVHRGEPYRVSCQATVWNTAFLARGLACVPENEGTPSDFEVHATREACSWPERVLCVPRSHRPPVLDYFCTAVIRGKWHADALALCAREGVPVKSSRPVWEGE